MGYEKKNLGTLEARTSEIGTLQLWNKLLMEIHRSLYLILFKCKLGDSYLATKSYKKDRHLMGTAVLKR